MLDDASLVRDKQHCRRIGPCGVGRRALYLNSYFIDRHYYVPFSAITRAFKFIEEGTGGVRVLAGRACLLVEYDGGMQQVLLATRIRLTAPAARAAQDESGDSVRQRGRGG